MGSAIALQYVVVGLVVVASALHVLNRQFPASARRWRVACALPLLRDGRPGWMRALGRRVAPLATGDAGACGGCNGCSTDVPTPRR